jgi:hypothetical protein
MADGELRLTLDDDKLRRLKAAAEAAGLPIEAYALNILVVGLEEDRWAESRRRLAEYDRTGISFSVEEGLAAFDAAVEARFPPKR